MALLQVVVEREEEEDRFAQTTRIISFPSGDFINGFLSLQLQQQQQQLAAVVPAYSQETPFQETHRSFIYY